MTEKSYLWTTGGAGDGAATYTRSDWSDLFRVVSAMMDDEGVAPAYLNALVGSTTGANNARIGTGGGVADGKPYYNSAAVDVTIPSATGGGNTRIDRVVLRADWTAQTVRVTRIAGTDAASPTAPAITQTSGSVYDIKLYQALVNTSGTVAMTDERTFAQIGSTNGIGASMVSTAAIADLGVTTAKIADSAVTAAKIANRTRSFLVSPTGGYDTGASGPLTTTGNIRGLAMQDAVTSSVTLGFFVPSDFVSGISLKMVLASTAAGNIYCFNFGVFIQASGETAGTHDESTSPGAIALGNGTVDAVNSVTLTNPAANDYVMVLCSFPRANAADTINGAIVYFVGLLVTYTADS